MAGHSKLQNEIPYFGVADWRAYACLDNSRCFHQGSRIGPHAVQWAFLRWTEVTTANP